MMSEEIDCFEDYDPRRCVDCEQKDECLFYELPKRENENGLEWEF